MQKNAGTLSNKLSKGGNLHNLITQTDALNFDVFQYVAISDGDLSNPQPKCVSDQAGEELGVVFKSQNVG